MLPGPLLQRGKVGRNQHGDELMPVADERGLGHHQVVCQLVFNRMRSNQLPARGLQQLFLAVGDEQKAIGVDMADVAGVEPPLLVKTLG